MPNRHYVGGLCRWTSNMQLPRGINCHPNRIPSLEDGGNQHSQLHDAPGREQGQRRRRPPPFLAHHPMNRSHARSPIPFLEHWNKTGRSLPPVWEFYEPCQRRSPWQHSGSTISIHAHHPCWSIYINQEMSCSAQPPWTITAHPIMPDIDTVTTTQRQNEHTH
jgi:hypothetical protein